MPCFRPLPAFLLLALLLFASPAVAKRDVAKTEGTGLYLVLLQDAPVPAFAGGVAGFAPTRAKAGGARFAPRSAAALAYADHLQRAQSTLRAELRHAVGREVVPRFTYRYALNGLALALSPAEARQVARLPGVRAVLPDGLDWPQGDASARHIGAEAAWGGGLSALPYRATLSGESVQPPAATAASGSARFTFNLARDRLAYRIQSEGLADLTAVHLHDAADDAILHTLPLDGDPLVGEVELDAAQRARLANGGLYLDIHTSAFPAGELRGAIALDGTLGEGVVVGVLDTGINHDHPSFAAVAGDGYLHLNPLGSGNHLGVCVDQPGFCNDKLIGAWTFTGEAITPEDTIGHGSHTASTAVGNILRAPQVALPTRGYDFAYLSGVAPRANLIVYDVCAGGCPNSATAAAVEQAILDGVDVLNYSISGGTSPWTEVTSLAFLNATAAGMLVVASAGNNGPAPGTINHVEPWVLSVAATSHPRRFTQALRVFDGSGAAFQGGAGEGPTAGFEGVLVDAADPPWNNPLCAPFAAGALAGQAVICRRGGNGRVEKGVNVLAAGGGALVLLNDEPSARSLNADPHVLPAVHLSHEDGLALLNLRAFGQAETVRFAGGTIDGLGQAGALASFSARGPGQRVPDVLKPDLAAPGAGVLAATLTSDSGPPAPEFDLQSGTSMASPQVAGLAALLRALRPDWTPAELKSALTGSAAGTLRREDGLSPAFALDAGSGAADLRRALRAGLVLDEDTTAYAASDPALGGDPRALNLPALADSRCAGGCGWSRRVRSVLASEQGWNASFELPDGLQGSVEPASFSLAPGAEQALDVRVVANGLETDTWHQGAIRLDPVATKQAMPIGVDLSSFPGLAIPDDSYRGGFGGPTMACDSIETGLLLPSNARVGRLQVELTIDHARAGDLVVKLQSPAGSRLGLLSRPGVIETADDGGDGLAPLGTLAGLGATHPLQLRDDATTRAEDLGLGLASGEIACRDDGVCVFSPAPGAVAGLRDFADFLGEVAAGTWTLCIGDRAAGAGGTLQSWNLGLVYHDPANLPEVSPLRLPLAIRLIASNLPERVRIEATEASGSQPLPMQAIAIDALQLDWIGLAPGRSTVRQVPVDPTPGLPFEGDGGTYFVRLDVPEGARRLVAEITTSEAPDADLYLGTGSEPDPDALVCASTTPAADEYCNVDDPEPGPYWILVQNWEGSAQAPDAIGVAWGVVPDGADGNFSVQGPASVASGTPFDLALDWNDARMTPGSRWYGLFRAGTDAANPDNLGTVRVDLVRAGEERVFGDGFEAPLP